MVTFLYGCAATFAGVFIIAWDPSSVDEDEIEAESEAAMHGDGTDSARGTGADEGATLGLGTLGRRRRATLVLPSGVRDTPILRNKPSVVSMIGISPAQVCFSMPFSCCMLMSSSCSIFYWYILLLERCPIYGRGTGTSSVTPCRPQVRSIGGGQSAG